MADRRRFGPWIRIAVSLVMLGVLVSRIEGTHIGSALPRWDEHTALWLGAALAVTAGGIVLSAMRWGAVLRALGLHTKVGTLLRHHLAGLFVGNFLPSTIGGDVVRVQRLGADTGDRADPFASVVLERLTGWLVLPLLTLGALAVNPGLRELGPATAAAVGISVTTLVALVLVVVAAAHPRIGGRLVGTASWRRLIGAVHAGLDRFRHHPAAAAQVLLTGLAYQLAVLLAVFFAARALDLHPVGITAVLAFMPVVAIAQVFPLSFGGLGVREGALALFLGPLGVAPAKALALGLLVYGINLTVSLVGAPAFAAGSRHTRAIA